MDPSGFPEVIEYTMDLANYETVDLHLQLDRSMSMPSMSTQDSYGQIKKGHNHASVSNHVF